MPFVFGTCPEQVKIAHFAIAPSARQMPAGECAADAGFILSASVMG